MGCWGLVIYAMTAATCSGDNTHSHTQKRKCARSLECGCLTHLDIKFSIKQSTTLSFSPLFTSLFYPAILQKYLDNFDLSIKVIYILGTLGFSIGMKRVE